MSRERTAPNILLIMADQLCPQALPCYGHPLVKAPNLSALANRGTLFESAYTNFPLCAPARASVLAGKYANAISVWDNAAELPASTPTVAHYLRKAGYEATLCGKMHFVGPDQLHGYNDRLVTDIYPSNFAWTPDWTEGPRNRPTGINMRAVIDAGSCLRTLQIDYDDEVEFFAIQKLYDLARFSDKHPFFLTISFTHPHSPFIARQDYWDLYKHDEIDMPKVAPIPLEEQDEMSRWLHYAHGGDLDEVSEEHVRNARHAYYGMISFIDAKVGHILKTLKDVGLDKDTLVIFTADHGEMLGERGGWYKQYFYEPSVRIPLIIAEPGQTTSRRVDVPVSLIDLAPTFLDYATAGKPWEPSTPVDGHSLRPLISGKSTADIGPVISEYTGEGGCAPCRMVRKGQFKFIYTHGFPDILYDLKSDPLELTNLAARPEYAKTVEDLRHDAFKDWNPWDVNEKVLASQRDRRLIQTATGGEPNWAFKLRPDDDRRYVRNSGAVQTKAKARYPFIAPPPIR
ncbi:MAG: choline-sulfatase [Pseudomonadota bacterium]